MPFPMGFGIAALRAIIGALFVGHGLQKLAGLFGGHGLKGTGEAFDQMGIRPGRQAALAAGLSETAGGVSLATGFLGPLGASAVTGTMAVAIAKVHGDKGLWVTGGGFEYNLVLGAAAFAIAADGPGRWSLDERLGTDRYGPGAEQSGRELVRRLQIAGVLRDPLADARHERLLAVRGGEPHLLVQALAQAAEVGRDVVHAAEVGQGERRRAPALEDVHRALPRLHVDVGRRGGREHELARRDAHAGDVAHVGHAARLVQVGDVVRGVPRRVLDAEVPEHRLPAPQDVHVRLGHRNHLAPRLPQPRLAAVQPRGARDEPLGRGHVARPALVDIDRQIRPAPHQRAGRARVVEVDVGEEDRARGLTVQRREQRVLCRLRPGVDEDAVDLPAADDLLDSLVPDIDGAHMARSHTRCGRLGPMPHRLPEPDRPWIMRTYAGHSTAVRSNALYRRNLAKGQTGLSIAFDLPTQTGYDPDDELARGEVGKVGVPVAHRGDMRALLDGIPVDRMNTSMTINATAAWLLALYIVCAEDTGADPAALQGTTQNDIIKEFLARGTYAFPPGRPR